MLRLALPLCLLAALSASADAPAPRKFVVKVRTGDRYTGSNTVTLRMTTKVRQGDRETESEEKIQRTERFLDRVVRAGESGGLEIERTYNMLYAKVTAPGTTRPEIVQNPLQGRTVTIRERRRRRDIKFAGGGGTIDVITRKTVGFELDWRDLFPDEPIAPGDAWEADSQALSLRLGAFLDAGNRGTMKVRFEEIEERKGRRLAKFYVDWTVKGMRDQHLFTKIVLAGDVVYDLDYERVTEVDLIGNMIVTGAIMSGATPRIIKGNGTLEVKCQVKPAPAVEASAPGD